MNLPALPEYQDRLYADGLINSLNGVLSICQTEELKQVIQTAMKHLHQFAERPPSENEKKWIAAMKQIK